MKTVASILHSLLALIVVIAASCQENGSALHSQLSPASNPQDTAKAEKPGWLVFYRDSVAGHFSDRHRIDTLRTCVIGRTRQIVLDSVPNTEEWIDNQAVLSDAGAEAILYGSRTDTLTLQYFVNCLINLGDIDGDGLDDLAISDDAVDMSSVNSCQIYSRKTGRWECILSFNVSEHAFEFNQPGDSVRNMGVMVKVPEFLRHKNGRWYFQDYLVDDSLMDNDGNLPWHRIGPHFSHTIQYGLPRE